MSDGSAKEEPFCLNHGNWNLHGGSWEISGATKHVIV
jgi:hypothetical protein